MSRSAPMVLAAVSLLLLAFSLTPEKPGLPPNLKADEPAYFLMAESLAHDGDLRLQVEDLERVVKAFPFSPVPNVIIMTDDGWQNIFYSKPYIYSLFAAPFSLVLGANGLVVFNMLLTVAMMWMGFFYLRRFNSDVIAALFSAGFFLVSAGFAYVFWMQPEVFNMTCVASAFFFGFKRDETTAKRLLLWSLASGAVLALAVYNKPMLVALGLPIVVGSLLGRKWKAAAAWCLGLAIGLGAVAGLATALTGHPTPYLGVQRKGVSICEPDKLPVEPVAPTVAADGTVEQAKVTPWKSGGSWNWIFKIPTMPPRALAENLTYFLVGRHTGLFLYQPFVLLALLLFLVHGRRDLRRWTLLISLAVIAVFFILFIPWNWQGGGGFVGNRYFVNAVPAFLFLVTGLRPQWLTLAGYALGGLLVGPIVLAPWGRPGPEPTLQSHTRNAPFPWFPLELSLRQVPGYYEFSVGGHSFRGRKDLILPRGETFWVRGASRVEVWITGYEPIEELAFKVRNAAPNNRIELELGGVREVLEFELADRSERSWQVVSFRPDRPDQIREQWGNTMYVYRMIVSTSTGRIDSWKKRWPPNVCSNYVRTPVTDETFFAGAVITSIGSEASLEANPFAVEWLQVDAPPKVVAGQRLRIPVRLANRSAEVWKKEGVVRVRLSYHWLFPDRSMAVREGLRTEIGLPVEPGEETEAMATVIAPDTPGKYILQLDLLLEQVRWFSGVSGAKAYHVEIEVVPKP